LRPELSWTHYRIISRIEDNELRLLIHAHAIDGNWDTPTLQRNTNTLYLGRILEVPKTINGTSKPDKRDQRPGAEERVQVADPVLRPPVRIHQPDHHLRGHRTRETVHLPQIREQEAPQGDPGFVDISGSVELSSLRNVMTGDNSETNKRRKFEEVIGSIFLSYVNDRVDFNQKFENPVIRV